MITMRDKNGRFKKGAIGWWKGRKRLNQTGVNNPRWSGGEITKNCKFCKSVFTVRKYREKTASYCSHKCRLESRHWVKKGKDNNWWKGGTSKNWDLIKESDDYKQWRKGVYERDWFRCRMCEYRSKKKGDIHAHHIIPMRDNESLWFEISNGITLCTKCHRMTYGKENNFVMVFKEILNDCMLNISKG